MTDRLAEMFERQLAFNRKVNADKGVNLDDLSRAERVARTKDYILHVEGELHELLGELDWKMHRRRDAPPVRSNVLEEYVDGIKFIIGLANVWGFSAEEVFEEFQRKSQVVEYKYAMEQRLRSLPSDQRVVGIDIDGVLNDYPDCFVRWVNRETGDQHVSYAEMIRTLGVKEAMDLKDAYRQSGAKREQGVRDGARDLINGLRAAGYLVVIISRRPYWRFSRIYGDTLEWLSRNWLQADAVLFHPEKHRKILEDFPKLVALVEDEPATAREVIDAGTPVVLVNNEMNCNEHVEGAASVPDLREALTAVLGIGKEER